MTGFLASRERTLDAIYQMGAKCCAYSIGNEWADFCDCKFGIHLDWPVVGEQGNGCPELRTWWAIVNAMNDKQWARFVKRANRQRSRAS